MDTLAVHDIIHSEIYRILRPDTIVVTGKEITQRIAHSRLSADTIINIKADGLYRLIDKNDTLFVAGNEILQTFPLTEFRSIMGWGAFFIGFVLGWNLYFLNRHRGKTGVAIGDITIISGAVMSAVIFSFFDANLRLLGWYGVGLGAGFIIYGIILFLLVNICKLPEPPLPARFKSQVKMMLDYHTWPVYWKENEGLNSKLDESK